MALTIGARLGAFEITGLVGAGGMGEVFRARDTRLGRDVAIKVLPDLFARDPERMSRFEREAQLLASMNHPHIASVYGVEETHGLRALVMELVDGPTLADRIAGGPLPIDEALPIARQIADALEAAHDRGIIHRDLKPANVKLTAAGAVKVLDFGLAKAVETTTPGGDLAHSPTMSVGTKAGVILGTAAYMSPEQARGRLTDRRTDIWAFGCVLFEMLTARQAFAGESVTDLIAAIVKEEPDWSALPADVPHGVVRLLQRCLRKDAKQRLHDIGDARLELEEIIADPSAGARSARALTGRSDRRTVIAFGVLSGVLALLAAWLGFRGQAPAVVPSVVRFEIGTPPDVRLGPATWPAAVLSPDGTHIALTASRQGAPTELYVRSLDKLQLTALPGTKGATAPFFSADGRWIAFTADNKLKKIPREGGTALTICDADWGGGTWSADDTIVYTPNYSHGLWKVQGSGGAPQKLTDPDPAKGELGHWWPELLPGGRHIVFTAFSTPIERSRILLYSMDDGKTTEILEGAMYARYVPSGHLVYLRKESVAAAPFDVGKLQLTGREAPVLDNVSTYFTNGIGQISVAANGTLAFVSAESFDTDSEVVWVDAAGKISPALPMKRRFSDPRLSPDGRRLAITIEDGQRDVWTYDFDRAVLGRVTSGAASDFGPHWLPDGRSLVFASETPVFQIFRKAPSAAAPDEPLVQHKYDTQPVSISPDGKFLVYSQSDPQTRSDLWLMPLTGERKPQPLIASRFREDLADISPDGRWIAYASDESGRSDVYVQSFPAAEERVQVSDEAASEPRWSADGKRLFYAVGNPLRIVAVPVAAGAAFSVGKPIVVFQGEFTAFDVAPDGRVLVVRRDPQAPPPSLHVVLNWFEELRAKFRS